MTATEHDPHEIDRLLGSCDGLNRMRTGAPTMFGFDPTVYASTSETVLADAHDFLTANGYAPILVETKIVAPNFYSVTYARRQEEFVLNETFALRYATAERRPLPLFIVSHAPDGTVEPYGTVRSVYDTESVEAAHIRTMFMLAHRDRTQFWLPRYAMPASCRV